jgi:ribosome-binding factor A
MGKSVRQNKVAAQIQKIVAGAIQREVADPRVDGLVSVTKVDVSPDLREAKVWLSILAAKRPDATVLAGVKSAGRRIQGEVADKLPLRNVPRLTYALDETLKKQADIFKKINEAMADTPSTAPAAAEEGADNQEDQAQGEDPSRPGADE